MSLKQQQAPHDSTAKQGALSRARRVEEGARYKLWAVGKYDTSVRQDGGSGWCRKDVSRIWRRCFNEGRHIGTLNF